MIKKATKDYLDLNSDRMSKPHRPSYVMEVGALTTAFEKSFTALKLNPTLVPLRTTAIAGKVHNVWLPNCIKGEIDKFVRKNENSFWKNRFTTTQILIIHQTHKKSRGNIIVRKFPFSIWFRTKRENGGINLSTYRNIGPAVRVFANGPGDLGSIPGRVIPKTLKMVLDTTLLNTQHYKVRFKGKVEQSWEWSSALPYTLV